MTATLGCMSRFFSTLVFAGVLGMMLAGAALVTPQTSRADGAAAAGTSDTSSSDTPVPNATYDETQPGADDPRVKQGFSAYQSGDFKKAYDIWLPLAEAGNAEAQFRVGRLYSFGEGVDKNGKEAVYWYKSAASLGHIIAMHNLAYILKMGEKVSQNIKEAISYYIMAAESGYVISQFGLGVTFATLEDKYKDFSLAYKWLYIALKNGHHKALDAIHHLNHFATPEERNAGLEKMREWFQNHPR